MRELLQQALKELREYRLFVEIDTLQDTKPTHLEQSIEAALSRSKWVKVADGLPVVPEGEKGVYVWVWNAKGMTMPIETFMTQQVIGLVGGYTHWQYRQDDTPAPPEEA